MNRDELDDVLEHLTDAEYEALLEAANSDRWFRWSLPIGAALVVFLPIVISITLYPLINPFLTTTLHRLAYAVFPLALLPLFYLIYRKVIDWFSDRLMLRLARLRGLIG
jgi:hypothetical protein